MYDISQEAIKIYQRMLMVWNGKDYVELLNAVILIIELDTQRS